MQTEALTFTKSPMVIHGKKLSISLDALNDELAEYKIKVDSTEDIKEDKALSEINKGAVLKIHCVYLNPDSDFDADWFFNKTQDLEDKFEALDFVYSAELDRGELVLILVLNKKDIELVKTFEKGGTMADDTIAARVDNEMHSNAKAVFELVGMQPPLNDAEAHAKFEEAKQKAIAYYKNEMPKPIYVFYQGRKLDIQHEASPGSIYLQTALTARIVDLLLSNMKEPNENQARSLAANKGVLAMDNVRELAKRTLPEPLHMDDEMVEFIANRSL